MRGSGPVPLSAPKRELGQGSLTVVSHRPGLAWPLGVALLLGLGGCQTSLDLPGVSPADVVSDGPGTYEVDGVRFPCPVDAAGRGQETTNADSGGAGPGTLQDGETVSSGPSDILLDGLDQAVGEVLPADDGQPEATCTPDCAEAACGDDGCGGSCGPCPTLWSCTDGLCQEDACVPLCGGKSCGWDGCSGLCGICPEGTLCSEGLCEVDCTCEGKECGDDGCGLSCGSCGGNTSCVEGLCEFTVGDLSCTEILGCVDLCSAEDAACPAQCASQGSATGQWEHLQYATCLESHGCQDLLCLADFCATETALCQYEEAGFGSCGEIVNCQNECAPGDQACIDGCIPSGNIDGQAQYVALVYCVQFFCPTGSAATCMNFALTDATLCGEYYQTCLQP